MTHRKENPQPVPIFQQIAALNQRLDIVEENMKKMKIELGLVKKKEKCNRATLHIIKSMVSH